MNERIEIRWHGRGGQGAKTASLLLADVAFSQGLYVQGFPEYGPERMGAPITAYTRLSSAPIRVHSNIYEPDYVVVMDETLVGPVDVTAGLSKDGAIVINSSKDPSELAALISDYAGRVYTVDAASISMQTIGRNIPNTPLLAAVVKVSGAMDETIFIENMRHSFEHKFADKPEVIEGNLKALKMAMEEVHLYER
ncbi:MAG: pyruvate synthase [Clostridia bacterium]|jgi:pyruvate ferredoxin oxidoreductase gamma subunit|nr:pyruvate synthase [Clostridia bacterium]MBT7122992.1 pyruvate synthase [Clostridia bacterium]